MKAINVAKTTIVLGLLSAMGSTANAGMTFETTAGQNEIDACVAAVYETADLRDARRVRHDVESEQRRSRGHKLTIDTRVYGEDGMLREYRAVCVVVKGKAPTDFELTKVETRS